MINIYVGPAIGNVMQQHALNGYAANALLTHPVPRWRAGGLTAAIVQISDWPTLAMVLSEIHQSEGKLALVKTRADYEALGPDTFGIGFSLEGYTTLAGDFDAIVAMSEIGLTAFTFSHNIQNVLCTGANERHGEGGFSHLGKATLELLSTLPVMVDLVHTSRASFWDAMDLYSGEVFVSHSNSNVVCEHPRNLTDEQVKAVAERGGMIGLNSYRGYVAKDPYSATISDYLDHAMHYYDLVGPKHIGIGADFWEGPMEMLESTLTAVDPDGSHGVGGAAAQIYATGPVGLEDISHISKVLVGLTERGLTPDVVDLVARGNYLAMLERARPSLPAVPDLSTGAHA
jgi:membrane dipeptidase